MKRIYKILSLLLPAVLLQNCLPLQAQETDGVEISIYIDENNTLEDQMRWADTSKISKLTLSGYLYADDLLYLCHSTFREHLKVLDLHEITIAESSIGTALILLPNTIVHNMFAGLDVLEKLVLPDNVEYIEDGGLTNSSSEHLQVEFANNPNFIIEDGIIFDKDKTQLIYCNDYLIERYDVPTSVKEIKENAFSNASNLIEITIPSSVERIGSDAFSSSCSYPKNPPYPMLKSARFVDGAEKAPELIIESFAFSRSSLTELTLPDNVKQIGEYAFRDTPIKTVEIKSSTNSPELVIENEAFSNCEITSLFLSDKVTSIGDKCFFNNNLSSIFIPSGVETIGLNAFKSSSLKNIEVSAENSNFSSENGMLLNKDKTTLVFVPNGMTGICNVPASVENISHYAFSDCGQLEEINLPTSIKTIGDYAFQNSSISKANLPIAESIGKYAFYSCASLETLQIPAIQHLPESVFEDCLSLTSLDMQNVTVVDKNALQGCGLSQLVLSKDFTNGYLTGLSKLEKVYSYNPNPPSGNLSGSSVENATLYVPKGSFSAYWLARGWCDFKEIIEMNEGAVEKINTNKSPKVYAVGGRIVVENMDSNTNVNIYNISGKLIYSGLPESIPQMPKGLYIVLAEGISGKVTIY